MSYRLFLFDLDGTLVDTSQGILEGRPCGLALLAGTRALPAKPSAAPLPKNRRFSPFQRTFFRIFGLNQLR